MSYCSPSISLERVEKVGMAKPKGIITESSKKCKNEGSRDAVIELACKYSPFLHKILDSPYLLFNCLE
jgi:hypothetical protein